MAREASKGRDQSQSLRDGKVDVVAVSSWEQSRAANWKPLRHSLRPRKLFPRPMPLTELPTKIVPTQLLVRNRPQADLAARQTNPSFTIWLDGNGKRLRLLL